MQIGQIVLTLVPILHPSADDILVTGNPYGRIKAVLAKKEFVNMDLSILEKFTYTAATGSYLPFSFQNMGT